MTLADVALVSATRDEIEYLWQDLRAAQKEDRSREVQDMIALRIVALSRLVGPTPWQNVPIPLLRNDTYRRVYELSGIAYPPFTPTMLNYVLGASHA